MQQESAENVPGPSREEVRFAIRGETCAAWLYRAKGRGPHPIVVMAHGLGATRELGLDPYARRFQEAGMSALVFDYRHYGASSAEPRELLSIPRQLADFRAAVAFARALPGVDSTRVAIWGSSFGGGHVMSLAAEELGLRAAVSQVPFSSGLASTLCLPLFTALRITAMALWDLARTAVGLSPAYIQLLGAPGEVALMSAPDCRPGYLRLVPPDAEPAGRWRNRVCARIGLAIPLYAPGTKLARARIPVFVAVAEQDSIAPAGPTIRAAEQNPQVELKRYPLGHFDYYPEPSSKAGAEFDRVFADEMVFLRKHLLA
ncbi:MAG: alpha/beta fold hydrolase [Myxococcales bacterium]